MTLGAHRKYHHDILNALFAPDFRSQKARLCFYGRQLSVPRRTTGGCASSIRGRNHKKEESFA